MRQAKRRRRGWEPSGWEGTRAMFSGMPDHLHWMWFWGTNSKISSMESEFLPTALRAITVPGPSTVYHLVFTPYSSFLTVARLKWFSPHGGGRFSIGFSQTSPSSPGHRWCLQCPMSGLYLPYQKNVSKIFSLKSIIHYDVDENLWPNPQDRVKTNIEVQWGTL